MKGFTLNGRKHPPLLPSTLDNYSFFQGVILGLGLSQSLSQIPHRSPGMLQNSESFIFVRHKSVHILDYS